MDHKGKMMDKVMKITEVFNQREAMCLMEYTCEKCGCVEIIWNSRPRVTPFGILCSECGENKMMHSNWQNDRYAPNHILKKGDRIFIDYSKEACTIRQKKQIDECWDHPQYPMSKTFETKEQALEELMRSWEFGSPTVITI